MKCLEREQLFAFAHGMLETREADVIRGHLNACPACQEVVMEYQRLDSALDEWKPVEPSAGFDARVRQAVRAQGESKSSSLWSGLFGVTWARWLAPASLAVIVGVVALGLYRSRTIPGPATTPSSPPYQGGETGVVQRPAATPAPEPATRTRDKDIAEKKTASAPAIPPARQEAPAPKPSQEPSARFDRPLAERDKVVAVGAAQNSIGGITASSAGATTGGVGVARPATISPAPSEATQSDSLARAVGARETAVQPSMTAKTFGALESKPKQQQTQSAGMLPPAQNAPATAQAPAQFQVQAQAQAQAPALPPAASGVAEAQAPAARSTAAQDSEQGLATPSVQSENARKKLATSMKALAAPQPNSAPQGQMLRSRSSHAATPEAPSLLESFMKQHPDAVLKKGPLGTLKGNGATKATFTAVVASDPADPSSLAKGMEVHLEDGTRTENVYLDDDRDGGRDNLKEIQEMRLGPLSDKDQVLEEWRNHGHIDDYSEEVGLVDRTEGFPRYSSLRIKVLFVGWYRQRGEVGVLMHTMNPDEGFFFPGTELVEVIKMIAKGRAFLDAN